jgi:RecG-like helicase
LRGPGELTGLAQSGLPRLRFATFDDLVKIEKIKTILPELIQVPQFREAVDRFWRMYHPE